MEKLRVAAVEEAPWGGLASWPRRPLPPTTQPARVLPAAGAAAPLAAFSQTRLSAAAAAASRAEQQQSAEGRQPHA